jgi:acetyl-CoA carboxylase carboxyl transferase subunit alpha
MGITAHRLKTLGLIDKIISEPPGGAHRDYLATMQDVRKALEESLKHLQGHSPQLLLERRFTRLMGYGKFKEAKVK